MKRGVGFVFGSGSGSGSALGCGRSTLLAVLTASASAAIAGQASSGQAGQAGKPAVTEAAMATAVAMPDKPRAFGHFVGDLVERHIALDLPAGLVLDPTSLPTPGQRGKALELRSVHAERGGLTLVYQVFLAPREVRSLEMPPLSLRATGGVRPLELRVDAWPVTVAPLLPAEVSPREGLGELRPDVAPPLIATDGPRRRLMVYAVVAALLLAWLAQVYLGLPWWNRRHRPFSIAWKRLAGLPRTPSAEQRREAWTALHHALNRTAGEVLFEPALDRFIANHPAFAPLQSQLKEFFQRSRAAFFGAGSGSHAASDDADWLRQFCQRCRDVERGAA